MSHEGDVRGEVRLRVDGMDCPGCAVRVQRALEKEPGVRSALVNLNTAAALIEGDALDPAHLAAVVERLGYSASPLADHAAAPDHQHRREHGARTWRRRALVGASCWLPMEMLHWFGPSIGVSTHEGVGLVLTAMVSLFVLVFVGGGFYASAWRAARGGGTNMDTLISIGASAAFAYSMVATAVALAHGTHPSVLYFAETAGLLSLVSIGHWIEAHMTAAAGSALRDLLHAAPDEVRLVDADGSTHTARTVDVCAGDVVLVPPGQRVPIDGVIESGFSALDESIVTGESVPVERGAGDAVVAGAMNTSGQLTVRATGNGRDTTLTRIASLVERAQGSKARVQRLADRISAVFVPGVIAISGVTLVAWAALGGEGRWTSAIVNATTVLVISCPCALGLATPAAVMVGAGWASLRGILIRSASALERAATVRHALFDKTGTLTVGTLRVVEADDKSLALAAAAVGGSTHPVARAIRRAASERGLDVPGASGHKETPGVGARATVEGHTIEVIGLREAAARGFDVGHDAGTTSLVLYDGAPLGRITLRDEPRPDARDAIAALRTLGVESVMISGDRAAAAHEIGALLGLAEHHVRAELTPADKLDEVMRASESGPVAMVGDGVNDAPALAQAGARGGIGVAIGAGADVSIEAADVIVPGHDLRTLPTLIGASRTTLRVIKQNLFCAFIYNSLAIPAAALGLLGERGPIVAAAAMALSDVCVLGNALRLRWLLRTGRFPGGGHNASVPD